MKDLLLLFDGFHVDGGLGAGAFYALFGLVFVFAGIVLLVGILTLVGLVMKRINLRRAKKSEKKAKESEPPAAKVDEGIPPAVVAAITAAIAVYTEREQTKCDFVVRRIKKL